MSDEAGPNKDADTNGDGTQSAEEKIQQSIDLLNATHSFPCPVMVKVIGRNDDAFINSVVAAIRDQLELSFDPPIHKREAKGGRHVSVTIEPTFDKAEDVLQTYDRIRVIDGVVMVL